MELLRIIAMVLVLFNHTGFLSLGIPTSSEVHGTPIMSFLVFSNMALTVVCVNTFVLLSGWFGIKWHKTKIMQLIFQVLFFSILVFTVMCTFFPKDYLNIASISTIFLLNSNDYWFIKSYLLLFLLAPILNTYIKSTTKNNLRTFLLLFYCFQTIYGWLSISGATDFGGGYSVVSFIGLYILARYIRLYEKDGWISKLCIIHFIFIYFCIALLQSIVAFLITHLGIQISGRLFTYTNPLVIIQAIALLMIFARMPILHNRLINWIGSSCLAAYLLHANELVLRPYYGKIVKRLFTNYPLGQAIIYTTLFVLFVFIVAIILDKIRILLWNKTFTLVHRGQKPLL